MTPSRLVTMQRRMRAQCGRFAMSIGRVDRGSAARGRDARDRAGGRRPSGPRRPHRRIRRPSLPVAGGPRVRMGGGRAQLSGHVGRQPLGNRPTAAPRSITAAGSFASTGDTNLHVSRLDDSRIALFVAQGRVIVRVRVLGPGDAARIDTPKTQVQLTRTGLYRIDVSSDRQATVVTVREGEALVSLANGAMQALPGHAVTVSGPDPAMADVRNSIGQDGFDTWSAEPRPLLRAERLRSVRVAADGRLRRSRPLRQLAAGSRLRRRLVPELGRAANGRLTATDTGRTWVAGASPGSISHRGATHLSTTAAGPGSAGAGAGAPGITSRGRTGRRRWSRGAAARGGVFRRATGSPVYGWLPLGWRDPYLPSWRRCSNRCWTQFNLPYGVNVRERPRAPPPTMRTAPFRARSRRSARRD